MPIVRLWERRLPQLPVHAAKLLNGGMPFNYWLRSFAMGAAPILAPRFFKGFFQQTLSESSLTPRQKFVTWIGFVFVEMILWCAYT